MDQASPLLWTLPFVAHKSKKPHAAKDVLSHFGVPAEKIVVIGDRLGTDVLMARRAGMLSILTRHFTDHGDDRLAVMARRWERRFLRWRGWDATMSGYESFVKGAL